MHADLMLDALNGLSVGDAVGAEFPVLRRPLAELATGELPPGRWEWTDDTEMASTVVAELLEYGELDQDRLAAAFAERIDQRRDYGFMTVDTLGRIRRGTPWREVTAAAFGGQGSCGNGAAMRVAPLGAYYFDDPEKLAAQAIRSAQVTHAHPEGISGALAIAHAAALAAHARRTETRPTPEQFITALLDRLDPGETTRLIHRARTLLGASIEQAAAELGNGVRVTAQDTVPFTIWSAATHLGDYRAAVATCIAAGGDTDTTAAITGGIVATYVGGPPHPWLAAREPLPAWVEQARRNPRKPASSGRLRRWLSGSK
ncbi:ADP-ribosylglycohydrolase family protein [Nocardia sp. CDC153]|uniref:ADP-ribosylglycohydrolase family protein n=1 Tax=Nocardia sp. CDC153 TaxID=3112167 RepID=UPI002DBB2DD1|nr:ADP-ribosylglycohydrolase family protein [Nocardia sp. CDC153]MEC3951990.1 ADP-ribosylglycohydrolase family protein [Nocardia sp. CDC153]